MLTTYPVLELEYRSVVDEAKVQCQYCQKMFHNWRQSQTIVSLGGGGEGRGPDRPPARLSAGGERQTRHERHTFLPRHPPFGRGPVLHGRAGNHPPSPSPRNSPALLPSGPRGASRRLHRSFTRAFRWSVWSCLRRWLTSSWKPCRSSERRVSSSFFCFWSFDVRASRMAIRCS